MKGIILAGGKGSRLYPLTISVCKQLLPVYDKPMIYYPLSVLMLAGIKDVLIITSPENLGAFESILGNGKKLGINISYKVQQKPAGIAEAFILGEDFIGDDNVSLILGDNIFHGHGFIEMLENCRNHDNGAIIFGYYVNDPERYGVVDFNEKFEVLSVEEKPEKALSNYAVVGLYFYDNDVVKFAKKLKPSQRGELEITDLNRVYLNEKKLKVKIFGRGFAWLDAGTIDSLHDASSFVKTIEERQGLKIACIEEIAFRKGFISLEQFKKLSRELLSSEYRNYLNKIAFEVENKGSEAFRIKGL